MAEIIRSAVYPEPPDLLKRFVPTPLRANLRFGDVEVLAQTNDSSILNVLRQYEDHRSAPHQPFVWTLVRDSVEALLLQPTLIHRGQVTFVNMGRACVIAIDHDTRELFGFLGTAVDEAAFAIDVLPLLRELTQGPFETNEKMAPHSEIAVTDPTNV